MLSIDPSYMRGKPPRYCPSIEEKITRFANKSRHQIFLEPESLENQMVALYDWLTLNKLTLNMTKTETIFFGNSRKTNQCTNLKVKLNGKEIQNKPFVKYLGVYLDRNLTWKKHIDVIKGKAYNKYSQIKGLYNILTAETRTLLYYPKH